MCFITAGPITNLKLFAWGSSVCVCVYYCRTYYKAVRVGEEDRLWRTCAMRYDEPRLVWTRLTTTH